MTAPRKPGRPRKPDEDKGAIFYVRGPAPLKARLEAYLERQGKTKKGDLGAEVLDMVREGLLLRESVEEGNPSIFHVAARAVKAKARKTTKRRSK